jgi:transcriptional regulator with XRE-family HTH domain
MTTFTLGQTLRAWRQRVSPAEAGLPFGRGLRRTPGLRREELAWLAGVSPDYVKRLEQDRGHPSSDMVRALARALRVTRDEQDMLLRLAGHSAVVTHDRVSRHVTPGLLRLTDRLTDVPLAVYDAAWTLLTANELWAAIFGDFRQTVGRDRNVIWQHFTGRDAGITHRDPDAHERALVADLRRATEKYPHDPDLVELTTGLVNISERFAQLWSHPDVVRHVGQRKTVRDTAVGEVTVDCDVLTVHDADLRVVVFTVVAASEDAEKLAMLGVLGLQSFANGNVSAPCSIDSLTYPPG